MKSLTILFASVMLVMSLQARAQDEFPEADTAFEEQEAMEGGHVSELSPLQSTETQWQDLEGQDEVIFPHGEENNFSLGSEELAAEDFD